MKLSMTKNVRLKIAVILNFKWELENWDEILMIILKTNKFSITHRFFEVYWQLFFLQSFFATQAIKVAEQVEKYSDTAEHAPANYALAVTRSQLHKKQDSLVETIFSTVESNQRLLWSGEVWIEVIWAREGLVSDRFCLKPESGIQLFVEYYTAI